MDQTDFRTMSKITYVKKVTYLWVNLESSIARGVIS